MEDSGVNIRVNVKLDRDDVGEMNVIYLKTRKMRHKNYQLFTRLMVVLMVISFIIILISDISGVSSGKIAGPSPVMLLAIVFLILYIVYNFGLPLLIKALGKRQFDSNKLAQKETKYQISSEGIQISTEVSTLNWSFKEIYKVLETENYIFLYESTSTVRIIPKRCFAGREDLSGAVSLLKGKIPAKRYEYYKLK